MFYPIDRSMFKHVIYLSNDWRNSKMFRSSSFSSSSTSFSIPREFSQSTPWQPPHAATHVKPFLRHEHVRVPQGWRESTLQLQRITWRSQAGAGSRSVLMGSIISFIFLQPHSFGSKHVNERCFHQTNQIHKFLLEKPFLTFSL